jgi:maltose O-acetyltransferase
MQEAGPAVPERVPAYRRAARLLRAEYGALNLRWLLASGLARLLPRMAFVRTRTVLYRLGGVSIGRGTAFYGPVTVWAGLNRFPGRLKIGMNCRLNSPLYAELDAPIHIGDSVAIGWDVRLVTSNHEFGGAGDRAGPNLASSICIDDGCWIGAGVTVLPGVTIGRGSIVAAGSVVTASCQPASLLAGNPARIIRGLGD